MCIVNLTSFNNSGAEGLLSYFKEDTTKFTEIKWILLNIKTK